jgi:hypothetical protein
MNKAYVCLSVAVLITSAFGAKVNVSSPDKGATLQSPVHFVATATSKCSRGISAIGIYTAPGKLDYVVNGKNLDTKLPLSPGDYNTVVEEWDNCGGDTSTIVPITVKGGSTEGVFVTSPAKNANVGSQVRFAATATTGCKKGVAAMGIYTAPFKLAYAVGGAKLNKDLNLGPGTYDTVVQEWDNCGGGTSTPVKITVGNNNNGGGSGGGKTLTGLHDKNGWSGYALLPNKYLICNYCKASGPEATWGVTKNIKSPSLSGSATRYDIGGKTKFADVLWNNHLIGAMSSQGVHDNNHTLVPSLHHFTYDVYFFVKNIEKSQALEFDINQFFSSMGFIWGHECRIAGGHEWDTWDNVKKHWVKTGIPCNPVSNAWNHLVLQVSRTPQNKLVFESITLNGKTHNLNVTRPHGTAGKSWWGVTINYQVDGNRHQDPYTVYLDKLNFTYK